MEGLRNNKLAEDLLHLALAQGASDMHIEPDEQGVRVRIRVDGLLQHLCVLPRAQQSTLLTQLKVWILLKKECRRTDACSLNMSTLRLICVCPACRP